MRLDGIDEGTKIGVPSRPPVKGPVCPPADYAADPNKPFESRPIIPAGPRR